MVWVLISLVGLEGMILWAAISAAAATRVDVLEDEDMEVSLEHLLSVLATTEPKLWRLEGFLGTLSYLDPLVVSDSLELVIDTVSSLLFLLLSWWKSAN